jgi:hypothetical protein
MPLLDEFFPFDIGHGNPANTARWRKMAQLWVCDGVFAGYLNQLNASIAGGIVTVQTGGLYIHGYYGEVQNVMSVTGVGTNGTVVAGVDMNAQTISIYYRDGVTDYGSTGSNYTQSATLWEMPLWLVTNATTLVDLRTMLNPGAACSWWGSIAGPITVAPTLTVNTLVTTLRIPYAGKAIVRGELLLTYSDGSAAQSAPCTLVYQNGLTDQVLTPTVTPTTPGGGPAGQPSTEALALSGLISVTQGKKTLGWRVTAGTGPQVTVATLTAQAQLVTLPGAG